MEGSVAQRPPCYQRDSAASNRQRVRWRIPLRYAHAFEPEPSEAVPQRVGLAGRPARIDGGLTWDYIEDFVRCYRRDLLTAMAA